LSKRTKEENQARELGDAGSSAKDAHARHEWGEAAEIRTHASCRDALLQIQRKWQAQRLIFARHLLPASELIVNVSDFADAFTARKIFQLTSNKERFYGTQ
jgi:hypothetical protein